MKQKPRSTSNSQVKFSLVILLIFTASTKAATPPTAPTLIVVATPTFSLLPKFVPQIVFHGTTASKIAYVPLTLPANVANPFSGSILKHTS